MSAARLDQFMNMLCALADKEGGLAEGELKDALAVWRETVTFIRDDLEFDDSEIDLEVDELRDENEALRKDLEEARQRAWDWYKAAGGAMAQGRLS